NPGFKVGFAPAPVKCEGSSPALTRPKKAEEMGACKSLFTHAHEKVYRSLRFARPPLRPGWRPNAHAQKRRPHCPDRQCAGRPHAASWLVGDADPGALP